MRFVLMCQVLDGEPPIQIKWFKDDQELTGAPLAPQLTNNGLSDPTEQVELVSNEELGGASLLFRRAQRQHGGNYTCVASNHFGATSYSSVMTVKGKFAELCNHFSRRRRRRFGTRASGSKFNARRS